jgi:hypothetical protein
VQPLTFGKQCSNGRNKCKAGRRSKGQSDTSVVNQSRGHLNVRGQVLYGGNGVSNLLDNLAQHQLRGSAIFHVTMMLHLRDVTFHLSGIPLKAFERPERIVF